MQPQLPISPEHDGRPTAVRGDGWRLEQRSFRTLPDLERLAILITPQPIALATRRHVEQRWPTKARHERSRRRQRKTRPRHAPRRDDRGSEHSTSLPSDSPPTRPDVDHQRSLPAMCISPDRSSPGASASGLHPGPTTRARSRHVLAPRKGSCAGRSGPDIRLRSCAASGAPVFRRSRNPPQIPLIGRLNALYEIDPSAIQ